MKYRRLLVTGASGFVGRHLIPHLLESGYHVRAMVRPASDRSHLGDPRIEIVHGDLKDPSSLRECVRGRDGVIHLAAATDISDAEENRQLNVDGPASLVRACQEEDVSRVVAFSSHCAGREKQDAYGRTKLEGERVFDGSGLKVTHLRPTMICGPGSKEFRTFLQIVDTLPIVPVIGPGTYRLRPCLVEDVVPLVTRCLEREETVGRTYEVAGLESPSMRELITLVAHIRGKRRRIVSVPARLCLAGARLLGSVMTHTPLSVDQVMAFLQHTEADIEPARRDLGFSPGPLEKGLVWIAQGPAAW